MLEVFDLASDGANEDSTILFGATQVTVVEGGDILLHRGLFDFSPLFYYRNGDFLAVSTSWIELVDTLRRKHTSLHYDSSYIAGYIAFQAPLVLNTLFSEVKHLRPGERHRIKQDGSVEVHFPEELPSSEVSMKPDEFRGYLEKCIASLDPETTVFHISSGLDSSIIAIMATRLFGAKRIRLATCRTRGEGCVGELDNVKRLAEGLGVELSVFDFTDSDVFAEGRELVSNCIGYPVAHPSHLVEYMLDKSISEAGAETIVNGKGPDDCLAGYAWHKPDYSSPEAHRARLMVTNDDDVCSLLQCSNIGEAQSFWSERSASLTLGERLQYDMRVLTEAWNIIHSGIASHLGLKIVSPFMDSELRSGMFFLPDKLKVDSVNQKIFLRETFAMDYPDYILGFPKQGLRLDLRPYFLEYEAGELFRIITGGSGFAERYFSLDCIRDMIELTLGGKKNYGWQLWSMYLLSVASE